MRRTSALAAIVAALGAPAAADRREFITPIGGLTLAHDAAEWAVSGDGEAWTIACTLPSACADVVVDLTIRPMGSFCDAEIVRYALADAFPWATTHAATTMRFAGLTLVVGKAGADTGGGAVLACVDVGGLRYTFASRLDAPPSLAHHAITVDLLSGLAAPR